MAPRWGQDGEQIEEKIKCKQKEGGMPRGPPCHFSREWRQRDPNLDPEMEPRWQKKRCLLGSICGWILIFFRPVNGAKLALKWDQTSILFSKRLKVKTKL